MGASEQGTTTACFRAGPPARGARNDRVRARRAGAREEGEHASTERSDGRAHAASVAKQEGRAPSERKRARRGARKAVQAFKKTAALAATALPEPL